jgi:hypothetical protein
VVDFCAAIVQRSGSDQAAIVQRFCSDRTAILQRLLRDSSVSHRFTEEQGSEQLMVDSVDLKRKKVRRTETERKVKIEQRALVV